METYGVTPEEIIGILEASFDRIASAKRDDGKIDPKETVLLVKGLTEDLAAVVDDPEVRDRLETVAKVLRWASIVTPGTGLDD